eukprot:1152015-Pelagomonas_calceolata.AAC.3
MRTNLPLPGVPLQINTLIIILVKRLAITRRAVENKNTPHCQALEPGASSDPPDPRYHSLFCSFGGGTHGFSEPMYL